MSLYYSDEDAIAFHLGQLKISGTFTVFSGFIGALRDARKFTLRDQETGDRVSNNNCGDQGSWLGAIGYLVLLDQIGSCFKPKGVLEIHGNSISKALGYFTNLNTDEIDAIYALRCALAHDYSLLNINKSKPNLTHHFALTQGLSKYIVTPPKIRWDGDIYNLSWQNVTYINLEVLGDCVEDIYKSLEKQLNNSALEITLQGGRDELALRYSVSTPNR